MTRLRGLLVVLSVTAGLFAAGAANAKQVVLRTKDGSFEIRGNLVEFDGRFYTIRSTMGQVRVPVEQVDCSGPGCPSAGGSSAPAADGNAAQGGAAGSGTAGSATGGDSAEVAVAVAPDLPETLLPRLVEAYATETGVTVTPVDGGWEIASATGSFRLTVAEGARADMTIGFEGAQGPRPGAETRILALDPVVAVTSPGSRPTSLSLQDLSGIYAGAVSDWSGLNVRGGKIVPVLPAADPVVDDVLAQVVLDGRSRLARTVVRTDGVPAYLLSNPGSIALVRASARGGLSPTPIAGECGLTATVDEFAVRSGQYPLVRRVMLDAGRRDMPPAVTAFLDFATGDAGQRAVEATGLAGQAILAATDDRNADWIASAAKLAEFVGGGAGTAQVLQDLVAETANAKRLSVTFRYTFRAARAAEPPQGDFARLAAILASGIHDGSDVVFIGFTDASDAVSAGRAASATAADRVLRDFLAAYPGLAGRPGLGFSAVGFGAVAPLLCSGTAAEQDVNQRVEVWIRPR